MQEPILIDTCKNEVKTTSKQFLPTINFILIIPIEKKEVLNYFETSANCKTRRHKSRNNKINKFERYNLRCAVTGIIAENKENDFWSIRSCNGVMAIRVWWSYFGVERCGASERREMRIPAGVAPLERDEIKAIESTWHAQPLK